MDFSLFWYALCQFQDSKHMNCFTFKKTGSQTREYMTRNGHFLVYMMVISARLVMSKGARTPSFTVTIPPRQEVRCPLHPFRSKTSEKMLPVLSVLPRGLQRDVVYLCWPIVASYTSPNVGGWGWGGGCGVSANEYMEPKKTLIYLHI